MGSSVQISPEELPSGWSEESRLFINGLIKRKESERLGTKGVSGLKEHEWFRGFNFDELSSQRMVSPFVPANVLFIIIIIIMYM